MGARWYRDNYSDAVWECETLTAVEKAVAETYARHARDERDEKSADADLAWVTYPRLMSKAGIKRRATVSAAVDRLEELGWLDPVERVSRRATVYRLTIPGSSNVGTTDPDLAEGASSSVGTTVVPLADHGSSTSAPGSSSVGTQPLVPLEKQPLTPSSCDDEAAGPSSASPKEAEEGEDQKKIATRIAGRYADRITFIEVKRLAAPIAAALRAGWTEAGITAELDQPTTGLDSIAAGLIGRAKNLGEPPARTPAVEKKPHRDAHPFKPDPSGTICETCYLAPSNGRHRVPAGGWDAYNPHANQPTHAMLAAAWHAEPDPREDAARRPPAGREPHASRTTAKAVACRPTRTASRRSPPATATCCTPPSRTGTRSSGTGRGPSGSASRAPRTATRSTCPAAWRWPASRSAAPTCRAPSHTATTATTRAAAAPSIGSTWRRPHDRHRPPRPARHRPGPRRRPPPDRNPRQPGLLPRGRVPAR